MALKYTGHSYILLTTIVIYTLRLTAWWALFLGAYIYKIINYDSGSNGLYLLEQNIQDQFLRE